MDLKEVIAVKIKKICQERGLSINKLSKLCNMRQSTIHSLIDGKSKNPKLHTIETICEGLNISLQDFFEDELFLSIERV